MAKGKYLKKNASPFNGLTVVLLLILAAAVCLLLWKVSGNETTPSTSPEDSQSNIAPNPETGSPSVSETEAHQETTVPTTEATTAPTEPYLVSSASIGVTGDMLIHKPMLTGAKQSDGSYDFTDYYKYIQDYYNSFDFMVANLEVTLGGAEAGDYTGYPTFNCPDTIVDALKNAGVQALAAFP